MKGNEKVYCKKYTVLKRSRIQKKKKKTNGENGRKEKIVTEIETDRLR